MKDLRHRHRGESGPISTGGPTTARKSYDADYQEEEQDLRLPPPLANLMTTD